MALQPLSDHAQLKHNNRRPVTQFRLLYSDSLYIQSNFYMYFISFKTHEVNQVQVDPNKYNMCTARLKGMLSVDTEIA